ncbi:MAG: aldo/keto reductase [Acidobacteriota bacterium]
MTPGQASVEGTKRFAGRSTPGKGHFRQFSASVYISSIGLGTYLGAEDAATDAGYEACIRVALESGVNVFDSAINYRGQKSERAIGRALKKAFEEGAAARDEVFVTTKGGYLPHDADDPRPPKVYIRETFLDSGLVARSELVSGGHCMSPGYLKDQLRRSRENLGLETIDLYYLHNLEAQRSALDKAAFRKRLCAAAEVMEEAAGSGEIGSWGLATWDGLRAPAEHPEHLSMAETIEVAREISGDKHHFRAVQMPFNLAMSEALAYRSQTIGQGKVPALRAAQALGLCVFGSATLLQGRLAAGLPEEIDEALPEATSPARRAIQFSRSASGMTTSLVGVSTPDHARDDFGLAEVAPADPSRITALFETAP